MKKRFAGLLIALLTTIIPPTIYGEEHEVLIGRVFDWPPFYYLENGVWNGSSVDAYRALADEAGIKLILKNIPWSRALRDMGLKHIVIADLTPTEERSASMYFFGPHDNETMGVALSIKYKNEKIESLDDLVKLARKSNRKVIYQQDYFFSDEFNTRIASDKLFAANFKKKASLLKNSIRLVAENKYLGYMEDKRSIVFLIKSKNLTDTVFVHNYNLSQSQVYMGVSKTISDDMYKKLKKADEKLKKNNIYKKLQKKWLSHQQ